MTNRLKKQIEFIREIDKIKEIYRHTSLFGKDRKENDAEHSWHICVMAIVLSEYSNEKNMDMLKILKMLLIHDLIEIYSGDYIVYTEKEVEKEKKEKEGAEKIFSILPEDQSKEFKDIWVEFEERKTIEAKFARVLDRLEPILQNYYNKGDSWVKYNISAEKIIEKNRIIKDGSEEIWKYVEGMINEYLEKGIIK
ncbi:HD domain-containing protein [Haliovirga abyssi]|uniref:Hydrolase n=1 Tax=Haliovirga abyssi TaxID=2996794 RepID=A0AAU9DE07_9FUSO|nr:HD domain-containing protein [Haliovirga abyssi]BDU50423.1 hydrolase [Haliovirga abyssi]